MPKVSPAGSPAWMRASDLSHYGGAVDKQDYLSRGPIDPLTDVGAASFARLTADMTAMVRTTPFAVLAFGSLVGGQYVVSDVRSMRGARMLPYAVGAVPPEGFPRVDRNGVGDYTIAFASEYADDYGVTAPFAIAQVRPGSAIHASVCRIVVQLVTPQSVRVRVFDAADAAVDPVGGISGLAVY